MKKKIKEYSNITVDIILKSSSSNLGIHRTGLFFNFL
jgi:hypothetical protein